MCKFPSFLTLLHFCVSTESCGQRVKANLTLVKLRNGAQSDDFWSDPLLFILFPSFWAARARSAADWVTVLKQSCCCLSWQQLPVCVHVGALQIELHCHKNSLNFCFFFSFGQIFSFHSFSSYLPLRLSSQKMWSLFFFSYIYPHCHLSLQFLVNFFFLSLFPLPMFFSLSVVSYISRSCLLLISFFLSVFFFKLCLGFLFLFH